MKPIYRIGCIAAAALLLTACGGNAGSVSDSAAETTTTAEQTSAQSDETSSQTAALTDQTTDSQAEQMTDQAPGTEAATDAPAESTTVTTVTTVTDAATEDSAPDRTTAQGSTDTAYPIDQIFRGGKVANISCEGTVFAPDGLNLRQKPSASSQKIKLLKDQTKLEVTGITLAGSIHDYEQRWLRVRAGSDEGYVLAEYVNCKCSEKAENLTEENRAALGVILYYQSMRLYLDFQREGGVPRMTHTQKFLQNGNYMQLTPKGMTLKKLKENFHSYFAKSYDDSFIDECYVEQDGYLWSVTGYGDNVMLDYVELDRLEKQEPNALTYNVTVHWFNLAEEDDFTEFEEKPFRLVYEDGCWKTAVMESLY